MTREEFKQKLINENLKMKDFDIVYDKIYENEHIMGCVFSNDKWLIYKTMERNEGSYIIKEFSNESEAFDYFYELVKFQIEMENN